MTRTHSSRSSPLVIKAGPAALARIRRDGLKPADIGFLPGAAGGPKAIGITGLDQAVFSWLAEAPRSRELVGASIGGWRFACAMQARPSAALAKLAERYTEEGYTASVTTAEITWQTELMLQDVLGEDDIQALLRHPHYRLSLMLVESHGLLASERKPALLAGLGAAALLNAASRPAIRHCFTRVIAHDPRSSLAFLPSDKLPTRTMALSSANLRAALMGTVAIPGVLHGVSLPGQPPAVYRDGGLTDYHLDLPFARSDDITLYPHFTDRIVPGWFDKFLPWRRHHPAHHANTVLLAPSADYLATLPGGKLPDRNDFHRFLGRDDERRRDWRQATAESQRLGDAFMTWLEQGCPTDRLQAL
ncbi:hypothetical protein [uncultured Aquitalea sp.]|uniref:hypothetical protein n=1 Tax=uncultured Aquitalea sp. TaxID=540272 RepID=UPI0025CFF661|nr:hypothetical protein [uncultured Aquitalea sp.]